MTKKEIAKLYSRVERTARGWVYFIDMPEVGPICNQMVEFRNGESYLEACAARRESIQQAIEFEEMADEYAEMTEGR